ADGIELQVIVVGLRGHLPPKADIGDAADLGLHPAFLAGVKGAALGGGNAVVRDVRLAGPVSRIDVATAGPGDATGVERGLQTDRVVGAVADPVEPAFVGESAESV